MVIGRSAADIDSVNERPRDRPPLSQPVGAAYAMGWLYLFWLFSVGETGIGVIALFSFFGDVGGLFVLSVVAVMMVPLLAVVLGARVGKRWALHLMRAMAATGTVLWLFDLAVGVLAVAGRIASMGFRAGSQTAVGNGVVVLIFCAAMAAPGFLLLRALWRVRWLDPRSRPSEWEKPMRSPARIRTGRW